MPQIIPLDGVDGSILARIIALEKRVKDLGNNNIFSGTNLSMDSGGHLLVGGLALSSVNPASVGGSASNFAISTTSTAVYTATVTVPSGYNTALVMSVCQMDVWNPTAGSIFAYSSVGIAGAVGAESDASVAPSTAATLTPAAIQSLPVTGLPSFTISVNVRASVALTATSSNLGTVNAIVIFLA